VAVEMRATTGNNSIFTASLTANTGYVYFS